MRKVAALFALCSCLTAFLAGCSVVPTAGPNAADVAAQRPLEADGLQYALVKVTPEAVAVLKEGEGTRFPGVFREQNRRPPIIRLGIGDVVSVTIFEAAAGGLFVPDTAGARPGNFVTVPDQAVDFEGFITVPYAGRVRAAGKTPDEVEKMVVERLRNRAIEPQVVVALRDQRSALISVLGEVNAPARLPAAASGDRILDAITRAGGPRAQGYESFVTLERRGQRATVPFGSLVYEPSNNIYIQPGDTIYVYREPQTFVAFGASGQNGQFAFDAWRITLAEGVAKAGGLLDERAEPAATYLYRPIHRDLAQRLGVDVSRFAGPVVPVIFNLNLRDPGGFFLATKINMQNKDVLYVSNAQIVEATKLLQFIRVVTATVSDAVVATDNAVVLRNDLR